MVIKPRSSLNGKHQKSEYGECAKGAISQTAGDWPENNIPPRFARGERDYTGVRLELGKNETTPKGGSVLGESVTAHEEDYISRRT